MPNHPIKNSNSQKKPARTAPTKSKPRTNPFSVPSGRGAKTNPFKTRTRGQRKR